MYESCRKTLELCLAPKKTLSHTSILVSNYLIECKQTVFFYFFFVQRAENSFIWYRLGSFHILNKTVIYYQPKFFSKLEISGFVYICKLMPPTQIGEYISQNFYAKLLSSSNCTI